MEVLISSSGTNFGTKIASTSLTKTRELNLRGLTIRTTELLWGNVILVIWNENGTVFRNGSKN